MEFNDFISKDINGKETEQLIDKLKMECICHICPTYNECTRKSGELLYCILGSSNCPINKRKCLCPQKCPVYQKYDFKSSFYCLKDKEIKRSKLVYNKQIIRV